MIKVAVVSSIRPETNYSTYLIDSLQKNYSEEVEVFAYCENEPENDLIVLGNKKYCWDRNWHYFFQILIQARQDKIEILHFQHEINMFGGPRTAVLFPFLILAARILGFKTVVTVHAAVSKTELNEEFLKVFEWPRPKLFTPIVRIVFPLAYFLIGLFAQKIIVHSLETKKVLEKDYSVRTAKLTVIPHGVPEDVTYSLNEVDSEIRQKLEGRDFLLFFGYLHRRKGLEVLLEAFSKIHKLRPSLYLVLAGGTIMSGYLIELKARAQGLAIGQSVLVTGFLGLPTLRFLLDHCLFVVLPAIYSIAASGPLAQAFAHEKAVIVSELGVYREEIVRGENGLLVKVRDAGDLTEKMEMLLSDRLLKERIVANVKNLRRQRAWGRIARQTLDLYAALPPLKHVKPESF